MTQKNQCVNKHITTITEHIYLIHFNCLCLTLLLSTNNAIGVDGGDGDPRFLLRNAVFDVDDCVSLTVGKDLLPCAGIALLSGLENLWNFQLYQTLDTAIQII